MHATILTSRKKAAAKIGGLLGAGHLGPHGDSHQTFRCIVVVVLQPIFVPDNLAIQLVNQLIHCSVQISVGAFCKHVGSFDMNIAFCSLPSLFFLLLFDCEQHLDIDDLVKMANDPIKLGRNITAQGWGNFKVMTADRQVHKMASCCSLG
jgi:hypothetical protein